MYIFAFGLLWQHILVNVYIWGIRSWTLFFLIWDNMPIHMGQCSYTVRCPYNLDQHNTILNTLMQWLTKNIDLILYKKFTSYLVLMGCLYGVLSEYSIDISYVITAQCQLMPLCGLQLILTVMLLSIIVYLYTVIAFNFFRKFYIQEEGEDVDYKCHDMLTVRTEITLWNSLHKDYPYLFCWHIETRIKYFVDVILNAFSWMQFLNFN